MKKKAVVLLSGGIDSTCVLFWAQDKGYNCRVLIFDYGQRHRREIESAKKIARRVRYPYKVIKLSLPWGGSSLLDKRLKISQQHKAIPSTYVPARNIIFLSFGLSYAEAVKAEAIFIGANAIDYSGYPDCRPGFYRAFSRVIIKGTKSGVE